MRILEKSVLLSAVVLVVSSCQKRPEQRHDAEPEVEAPPRPKAAALLPERVLFAYVCEDQGKLQEAFKGKFNSL